MSFKQYSSTSSLLRLKQQQQQRYWIWQLLWGFWASLAVSDIMWLQCTLKCLPVECHGLKVFELNVLLNTEQHSVAIQWGKFLCVVNNAEQDVYFHGLIDLTVISNGENEQDILRCCIKTDNVISSGKVNKILRPGLTQQHNQYLKQCNILHLITYFLARNESIKL